MQSRFLLLFFFSLFGFCAFAQPQKVIRVGAVGVLSGQGFTESAQAAKVYFDTLNKSGGINGRLIEYVSLDEGRTPQSAADAANRLISDPSVVALVGGAGLLDCGVNGARYAQANLISLQGSSVAWECFSSSHIVPVNNGPYVGMENAIAFAIDRLSSKSVCVNIIQTQEMAAGYDRSLNRLGPLLTRNISLINRLKPTDDFSVVIKSSLAMGCESMVFTGHEVAALRWIKDAQNQGLGDVDWIFLTPAYTDRVARAITNPAARVYVMAEFEPWQSASLAMLDWKRMMKQANVPLSSLSQGGYLSAQIFAKVVHGMNGPITRESFSAAFRSLPVMSFAFLGAPFEVKANSGLGPNSTSLAMVWRGGSWRIATSSWIDARSKN